MEVLAGARLHTPEGILSGRALLFADGVIRDIVEEDAIPAGAQVTRLAGGTLAAGFIDLQVNGGGGVMFNDAPTPATIAAIGRAHRAFGTTSFLPTFISGGHDDMVQAISAVREALDQAMPGVLGIHFEGPHINLARRGAHNEHEIRPLGDDDIDLLASLGAGLHPRDTGAGERGELTISGALAARGRHRRRRPHRGRRPYLRQGGTGTDRRDPPVQRHGSAWPPGAGRRRGGAHPR